MTSFLILKNNSELLQSAIDGWETQPIAVGENLPCLFCFHDRLNEIEFVHHPMILTITFSLHQTVPSVLEKEIILGNQRYTFVSAIYLGNQHFTQRCLLLDKIWEFDGTNKVHLGTIGLVGCAEGLQIDKPYTQAITGILPPCAKYEYQRKLENIFYLKN